MEMKKNCLLRDRYFIFSINLFEKVEEEVDEDVLKM